MINIKKQRYYDEAVRILKILAEKYQNTEAKIGIGILKEGMYHRNEGFNEYTSWGDYYTEALAILNTYKSK